MTEMRDTTEFWYAAGPKFNAYTVGNRSIRNICDGKSLMLDPLDDTQPIRLKNAAKSIYAGDKSLSSDRNPMPFYYFLDGDSGFEALVSKSDPIMLKTWPNNEQSIEFSSRAIGRANVFYTDFGKLRLVTRVQFDNLPWLTKMAVENPGDFSQPDPTALTIFNIEYLSVNEKIPDDVFDPTPPNGKQVEDERKKGG